MAHRRLPGFALEYLEGGAEEEATLARNLEALGAYRLVPRALIDVRRRDTSVVLFGERAALPFAIAPTGLNGLYWADADRLLAQAAAAAGVPFIQSTMSNVALEDIAAIDGLRHWFQLYVFGEKHVRETLIARACDAGCEALVLTTDAQIYGDREWERRCFVEPGRPTLATLFDAVLHPRWFATTLLPQGMPRFVNLTEFIPEEERGFFASAFWIRGQMEQGLDWTMVAQIRALWPRKFLIKGLLSVEDVRRAAESGADGVVLSNHGGRQLDWTIAGLDCLQEAREAVGERITIIVDGGMRRGTDVVKALALGADTVLVGRPILYGVAAAARAGADRALEILREELDRDLALLGAPSVSALNATFLAK